MNIKLENIEKTFGLAKVLDKASLYIGDGEVHALMGENGAGKSTLMNILTGIHKMDAGKIYVDGKEVHYSHPREAEKAGIVFIHQELNNLPDMTVEENIFIGKEIEKFGVLDKKRMKEETQKVLDIMGTRVKPEQVLSKLSIGRQQMVEIAKALYNDVKVLIMDEPTSALTLTETEKLFETIKVLKKKGVTVIYISHRMEEIFKICDKVTVLRDGHIIDTKDVKDTNMDELVRMMIGREIGDRYPHREKSNGKIIFEASHLNMKNLVKDVSFTLKEGEILGVSGLMGAGRSEIMNCIFGSMKLDSGDIIIDGYKVKIKSPIDAMKNGIGFITEDRKTQGLLLPFSIKDNISVANLKTIANNIGVINKKKEVELSEKDVKDFDVKTTGIDKMVGALSGGNQQKVVFAKWVSTGPKILILDEPTRGVDVGAKKEIYDIMNSLTKEGVSIIMVSSELPEIIGMSDRVMVIHEGKNVGIVENEDINEETIMNLATRGANNGKI